MYYSIIDIKREAQNLHALKSLLCSQSKHIFPDGLLERIFRKATIVANMIDVRLCVGCTLFGFLGYLVVRQVRHAAVYVKGELSAHSAGLLRHDTRLTGVMYDEQVLDVYQRAEDGHTSNDVLTRSTAGVPDDACLEVRAEVLFWHAARVETRYWRFVLSV